MKPFGPCFFAVVLALKFESLPVVGAKTFYKHQLIHFRLVLWIKCV